ncbi:MAG: Flp family type IVb pilin [Rhodospirillales bacterium]|nr:Flp family type IVb pilin [Rhodospirillales bacterium]
MLKTFALTARQLRDDKRGISALEYGLLAGLIAVVLIGVLSTLGTDIKNLFNGVSSDVAAVATST